MCGIYIYTNYYIANLNKLNSLVQKSSRWLKTDGKDEKVYISVSGGDGGWALLWPRLRLHGQFSEDRTYFGGPTRRSRRHVWAEAAAAPRSVKRVPCVRVSASISANNQGDEYLRSSAGVRQRSLQRLIWNDASHKTLADVRAALTHGQEKVSILSFTLNRL